jgi:long-chain acyl-CoA synthetase
MPAIQDKSIAALLRRRLAESPGAVALRTKRGDAWTDVSWKELGDRMEKIAAGLLTSGVTLGDGARITILGDTSENWVACDFAALSVGLVTIPVYATLLPEECGYIHFDTAAQIAIVENGEQLNKVRKLREGFTFFDKPYPKESIKLERIIVMNTAGVAPANDWESLSDLEARGAAKLAETAAERARRADVPKRDDLATVTYTSGTTGPPKGVIQTHANMVAVVENTVDVELFTPAMAEGGLFLILPLAHSFGRLIELAGLYHAYPLVISGVPTLLPDAQATRPGFFPAAPRVYEKMKSRIETAVATAPPMRQRLFKFAMAAGKATIPYRSHGKSIPLLVKLKYDVADRIVLSKLRARLGLDRCLAALSGSAPLSSEVHEFFLSMGLDLIEGYGLTETCPALTVNLPHHFRVGTVGPALPGVTVKIADDGEILAKGPNVTSGYLNRPDATGEAFDAEGWFHTGDLGSLDADGFVKITGRKKELMKTSGGKYIAPAKIEGRLKDHPLVQEAVAIADTRNFVTALLAVDPEELAAWAQARNIPADPQSDAVKKALQEHLDAVNTTLARFETVKTFRVVPPMTTADGLLTASLKVRRDKVLARHAALIDDMYKGGGGGD